MMTTTRLLPLAAFAVLVSGCGGAPTTLSDHLPDASVRTVEQVAVPDEENSVGTMSDDGSAQSDSTGRGIMLGSGN
jgi:hypothetical protein